MVNEEKKAARERKKLIKEIKKLETGLKIPTKLLFNKKIEMQVVDEKTGKVLIQEIYNKGDCVTAFILKETQDHYDLEISDGTVLIGLRKGTFEFVK